MKETTNKHHIQFRRDRQRLPRQFELDNPKNKVQLPIDTHNDLHYIIDSNPSWRDDLSLRIYFANMAYNGSLQDIPENMYRKDPNEIMRKN